MNSDNITPQGDNGSSKQPQQPLQPSEPPAHKRTLFTCNWFSAWTIAWQLAMVVLFGTCTVFGHNLMPDNVTALGVDAARYAMFQDTHVMMIIGFGFLYTLLRRYAWSGVSYNYIITVLSLQWGVLCLGFWRSVATAATSKSSMAVIDLELGSLVEADYLAATVLISFGAVIGRLSATQAILMTFFEVIAASANVVIADRLGVSDAGGSMLIHTFGASFGLACAAVLGDRAAKGHGNGESVLGTSRHNGTFAMIGTAFLFCFWPSFNAAMLTGSAQNRAVINTVLSICASVVTAFAVSKAVHNGTKFDMEHVQNSTLAGGVAVGAACDMLLSPWGAVLTGAVAGAVSAYGFSYAGPWLKAHGLTDMCGIFSLHFMPGLIGGTASSIAAAGLTGEHWTTAALATTFPMMPDRDSRSALVQGGHQMAMTMISLVFGACSGACVSYLIRNASCAEPMTDSFYEDGGAWNVPTDADGEDDGHGGGDTYGSHGLADGQVDVEMGKGVSPMDGAQGKAAPGGQSGPFKPSPLFKAQLAAALAHERSRLAQQVIQDLRAAMGGAGQIQWTTTAAVGAAAAVGPVSGSIRLRQPVSLPTADTAGGTAEGQSATS